MSQYEYHLDLVICIDATQSMAGVINGVKGFASGMHSQVIETLENAGKHVDKLRVKVIAFRDFAVDGDQALEMIEFKDVSDSAQETELQEFINSLEPLGGGDEPENGLEALALALQSDWTQEGTKGRHLVMLFTDAKPHPYGTVTGPACPEGLPDTLEDVEALWDGGQQQGGGSMLLPNRRRMFLFVPDIPEWEAWKNKDMVTGITIDDMLEDPEAVRKQILMMIEASV